MIVAVLKFIPWLMLFRKNGRDGQNEILQYNDAGQVYFEQAVGDPGLTHMCQQEVSYSSPIGILLLLQLASCKPQW